MYFWLPWVLISVPVVLIAWEGLCHKWLTMFWEQRYALLTTHSLSRGLMFDTVGWVIWPAKTVPEMTYYVFSGTLNPTHFTSCLMFTHLDASAHVRQLTWLEWRTFPQESICGGDGQILNHISQLSRKVFKSFSRLTNHYFSSNHKSLETRLKSSLKSFVKMNLLIDFQ